MLCKKNHAAMQKERKKLRYAERKKKLRYANYEIHVIHH